MKAISFLMLMGLMACASAATNPPKVAPAVTTKSAVAAVSTNAFVSWTAPTVNTDNSPIAGPVTYSLYRGIQGAPLVKTSLVGMTALNVTVSDGMTPGSVQCFAVTATVGANESAQSNSACASIALPVPGAPTQITVVIR